MNSDSRVRHPLHSKHKLETLEALKMSFRFTVGPAGGRQGASMSTAAAAGLLYQLPSESIGSGGFSQKLPHARQAPRVVSTAASDSSRQNYTQTLTDDGKGGTRTRTLEALYGRAKCCEHDWHTKARWRSDNGRHWRPCLGNSTPPLTVI